MTYSTHAISAAALALSLTVAMPASAGLDDVLKQGEQLLKADSQSTIALPQGVDSATLAKGLKEALQIGGERAIARLASDGGYANYKDVAIPLPKGVDTVALLLRNYGFSDQVDAFEASMNQAAEKAITTATPIFTQTLEQMTLEDVQRIYTAGETAATDYFDEKTRPQLQTKLKPLIEEAMSSSGVTQAYQLLVGEAENKVPMLKGMSPNLGDHVTEAALDGLFVRLAEEEKRIRQQPIARTTELLQDVFGKR